MLQEQAEEPEEEGRVACGDCRCGVGGDPTGGRREACWVKVAAVPVVMPARLEDGARPAG